MEEIALVCEHVPQPKGELEFIHFFCGNVEKPEDLKNNKPKRVALYKSTVALIRAYANIAGEMNEAGYTDKETENIKKTIDNYLNLREIIRKASGETLDLKAYEADMRFLIDNFIEASQSRRIDPFENLTLLEIIESAGLEEAINSLPDEVKGNKEAVAETIANNVRQKIIKDHLIDPAFFDEMSKLLASIIDELRSGKISYEQSLKKMADIAMRVSDRQIDAGTKTKLTSGQLALFNNLGKDEDLALKVDKAIRSVKQVDWRGDTPKKQIIKAEIYKVLEDVNEVERIFPIIEQQLEY